MILTLEDLKRDGWQSGINQIIQADCLDGMKLIPDKSVDLVLTDPPYGINYSNEKLNRRSNQKFKNIINDEKVLDFSFLLKRKEPKIIFGALNFFNQLPHRGIWICWDKRTKVEADGVFGSPFEMAWHDKIGGYDKIYRIMHGGVINADRLRGEGKSPKRQHPTQKPVELMRQIILDYSKEGDLILDPFMGSWTTARACKDLGRNFVGFELSEDYCKIGEERLRQQNLF